MTLKIQSQEDEKRQLNVTVEVSEMRIKTAMKKTARKYAGDLRVPGFRKGKAPYHVIEGLVGAEALRQEAIQDAFPTFYEDAIDQLEVVPYAQPALGDVKFETPFSFTLTVPLEPLIVLGDYRTMRKTIEPVAIKDEAIDEQITLMQQQQAETADVDRASALGDIVTVTGKGYLDDDADDIIFNEEAFDVALKDDDAAMFARTPFVSELVGVSAEQAKTFTITFPDDFDFAEFAGKAATFDLIINAVKEEKLPELDDAFAHAADESVATLAELRAKVGDNLESQAEQQLKTDLLDGAVETMLEDVEEMTYSPTIVEAEIDRMLEEMKQRVQQAGLNWEMFLTSSGRAEADMRDDYEDGAVESVERGLVLREFIRSEQLELTPEVVDAEVEKRVAEYTQSSAEDAAEDDTDTADANNEEDNEAEDDGSEMAEIFRNFWTGAGRQMLEQQLMMDRVNERVTAIYAGEAPELPAPPEESAEDAADDEAAAA